MKAALGKLVRQPINNKNLKRPPMSAYGCFYKPINVEEVKIEPGNNLEVNQVVPLKAVDIHAVLSGAQATVNFDMTYTNPGAAPIECTYEFPLEADTLLSNLVIKIGD